MTKTVKDILEPIVNIAYRAGKNNDHPNNANIHKVVDTALKELEAIMSERVIGNDKIALLSQPPIIQTDETFDIQKAYDKAHSQTQLQFQQRKNLQTALYGKESK